MSPKGNAGASEQVVDAEQVDEPCEPRPQDCDGRTLPVLRGDTGAADLDQFPGQAMDVSQVELALGVEASDAPGLVVCKEPRAADDPSGSRLPHQQVLAVGVELVDVQSAYRWLELGAQLLAEDLVAQGLRLAHLVLVRRQLNE